MTGWSNSSANLSVANIGYLTYAGSGGANATSNYAGINIPASGGTAGNGATNNDKGVKIALDPLTPINAYEVNFSYDSSNGTWEQNCRYSLTGGTINLGAGGLAIDLSNTSSVYTPYGTGTNGTFGDSGYSNINANPNGGTLNIKAIAPQASPRAALSMRAAIST